MNEVPTREQVLKDRCASYGWAVPFALKNWQDNFISQSSYMREFERWFTEKCKAAGAFVAVEVEIEDPYDQPLGTEADQAEAWKDYWSGNTGWSQGEEWDTPLIQGQRRRHTKWSRVLPMEHKIVAPYGDVGSSLVCH